MILVNFFLEGLKLVNLPIVIASILLIKVKLNLFNSRKRYFRR